jgi:tRNA dimethylallyltransferase
MDMNALSPPFRGVKVRTNTTAPARHLVLVGPTASGKSDLAVAAALALGDAEVVSADAMALYRGMDVGTATPTAAERRGVPHHLLDLVDPATDAELAGWLDAARAVLADLEARGRRAVVVGGTGLYVQALVDDLRLPGRWPAVRAGIEGEAASAEQLHDRLAALDPAAAARIQPGNRRRVVRALEVTLGSGRPFSAFGPGMTAWPAHPRFDQVGVWLPRAAVRDRIVARVGRMFEAGLVDEVRALQGRPGGLSRTARQALGYREVLAHLEEGRPLAACRAEVVARTQAFARRQRVWFRRDPRITWLAAPDDPARLGPALVALWSR